MDTKELIQFLLNQEKIKNGHEFDSMIFRDEPILKTARQVKNFTPKEIVEFRKQIRQSKLGKESEAYYFYHLGKQMENYEDDYFAINAFFHPTPTYQRMTDEDLRCYFGWRTKVRKNQVEFSSISFAYLYVYELLNQIGVTSPLDGYQKLTSFLEVMTSLHQTMVPLLKNWIEDYIVYYHLDPSLFKKNENSLSHHLLTLFEVSKASEKQIFEAIENLSTYPLKRTKIYQEHEKEVRQIIVKAYQVLDAHYAKKKRTSFFEKNFKKKIVRKVYFFKGSLFYFKDNDYQPYYKNAITTYFYQNHQWYKESYEEKKSKELGYFCLTMEILLKPYFQLESNVILSHFSQEIIKKLKQVIESYFNVKRKKVIAIDTSQLASIRKQAQKTFDQLITEEEQKEEEVIEEKPQNETFVFHLTKDAFTFLSLLFNHKDYHSYAKEKKWMISLLVDEINEKCFDTFQDNILMIDDNDDVTIVEDYIKDLKGMLQHENT